MNRFPLTTFSPSIPYLLHLSLRMTRKNGSHLVELPGNGRSVLGCGYGLWYLAYNIGPTVAKILTDQPTVPTKFVDDARCLPRFVDDSQRFESLSLRIELVLALTLFHLACDKKP